MPSKLGYWKIRAWAQPIRLLLKYVEEDFEDVRYVAGPEVGEKQPEFPEGYEVWEWLFYLGDYGKSWFLEKFKLGLDFPNIPYYKDDKVNISHHRTILRYLAGKYNLEGRTEEDTARIDMLNDECIDKYLEFDSIGYSPDFYELKDNFRAKTLPNTLRQFEDFLGDRSWVAGSYITWGDFVLYENLDRYLCFWPNCLQDFPKLRQYQDRFGALPRINAYIASDEYLKEPFNLSFATYGAKVGQCGPLE